MARSRNWSIDIPLNDSFREEMLHEALNDKDVNYFYGKEVDESFLRCIVNFKIPKRLSYLCKLFEKFTTPECIAIVKNPNDFQKLLKEKTTNEVEIGFGNVPPLLWKRDELLTHLETLSGRQEAEDFIKENYKHLYYFQTNLMDAMLDRMFPSKLEVKVFNDDDFLIQRLPGASFPVFDSKESSSRVRTIVLSGQPHTGKSALAVHIFRRSFPEKMPIVVSDIQDLRKYNARIHGGIIFDDIEFSSLSPSELLKFLDFEQEKTISKIKYGTAHIPRHVYKIITLNDYHSTFLPSELKKAKPSDPLLMAIKSRIHHIEVNKCLIKNCTYSPEDLEVKTMHRAICEPTGVEKLNLYVSNFLEQ